MRELVGHKVNPVNEKIKIEVLDEPGQGGACHRYRLSGFDTTTNPSMDKGAGPDYVSDRTTILFQNGPVLESGFNGITQESLLAIVEDRLLGFQSGQYSTRENSLALTHVQQAIMWLQKRTRDRIARGVEGTHAK